MLAVAGGKGGTGKTTTALGLAAALAGRRRGPLVVDADVDMPDLAVVGDIPARPGVDALAGGAPLDRVVHDVAGLPGVGAVPATPGADVAGALPPLRTLGGDSTVVLDCPAGASTDATRPLRAADRVLLVTTATRPAVEDTLKTTAMARALETPVAGVAVVGTTSVPSGLVERIGARIGSRGASRVADRAAGVDGRADGVGGRAEDAAGRAATVPTVPVPSVDGPPLDDDRVTAAYRRLAVDIGGFGTCDDGGNVNGHPRHTWNADGGIRSSRDRDRRPGSRA